jgi:hypothetical protein
MMVAIRRDDPAFVIVAYAFKHDDYYCCCFCRTLRRELDDENDDRLVQMLSTIEMCVFHCHGNRLNKALPLAAS